MTRFEDGFKKSLLRALDEDRYDDLMLFAWSFTHKHR